MRYVACLDEVGDSTPPAGDGLCSQYVLVDPPALIPDLSAEDALLIGGAIALVWALAYGVKTLVRLVKQA